MQVLAAPDLLELRAGAGAVLEGPVRGAVHLALAGRRSRRPRHRCRARGPDRRPLTMQEWDGGGGGGHGMLLTVTTSQCMLLTKARRSTAVVPPLVAAQEVMSCSSRAVAASLSLNRKLRDGSLSV